jgi:hypothetical protein
MIYILISFQIQSDQADRVKDCVQQRNGLGVVLWLRKEGNDVRRFS